MKRFFLFFFCVTFLLVSALAFSQTITVHDGTSPTLDIDWWSDTDFFYANWSSVDWSSAAVTDYKWYHVVLEKKTGSLWTQEQPKDVPALTSTTIPPTEVAFSDLNLIEGEKYRVQVTARHQSPVGGPVFTSG